MSEVPYVPGGISRGEIKRETASLYKIWNDALAESGVFGITQHGSDRWVVRRMEDTLLIDRYVRSIRRGSYTIHSVIIVNGQSLPYYSYQMSTYDHALIPVKDNRVLVDAAKIEVKPKLGFSDTNTPIAKRSIERMFDWFQQAFIKDPSASTS